MNWKSIILTFAISVFAFIFITSGYSYKEGFRRRAKRSYNTKRNKINKKRIANRSINKAISENDNIVNQLNRMSNLIYNTLHPNKRR